MRARTLVLLAALLAAPSCKKVIGDSCSQSTDCSLQGDRVCDLTQRDGYCTIDACDPGTCPDNAVCVAFNANARRLTRRFCMAPCDRDSDCRDGYRCVIPTPAQATCATTAPEILPPGQTCNVRLEASPRPGWCEVRPVGVTVTDAGVGADSGAAADGGASGT
ncbi:MAG: hypothetical protein U0325_33585 [Polyangiales bacterium]